MNTSLMSCERALMVLASHDNEHSPDERASARRHTSRCPRCSGIYDSALSVVAQQAQVRARPETAPLLRIGLAIVAAAQLVLAVPWLFGYSLVPHAHVAVAHLTRDGALGLVMASLGLLTAWRPRYVYSSRIVGLLVVVAQLIAGLTDDRMSPARPSFETVHLLVLLILVGLFAVGADVARRATPEHTSASSVLRSR